MYEKSTGGAWLNLNNEISTSKSDMLCRTGSVCPIFHVLVAGCLVVMLSEQPLLKKELFLVHPWRVLARFGSFCSVILSCVRIPDINMYTYNSLYFVE